MSNLFPFFQNYVFLLKTAHDKCENKPCKNGGTCVDIDDYPGYLCYCGEGYEGLTCDRGT